LEAANMAKNQNNMAIVKTGQNPVSVATIDNISLTAEERKRARKMEMYRLRAEIEVAAQEIADKCGQIKQVEDEARVLHRRFKDLVEEMRPAFEKVRKGFAHLKGGQKIMGETSGEAWALKHLGYSYDWLCRLLNRAKEGDLVMTDGVKVLAVKPPKKKKPEVSTADWSDEEYVQACVGSVEDLLKPLEENPDRWERIAVAVSSKISGRLVTV
jgi:hypothetical protein